MSYTRRPEIFHFSLNKKNDHAKKKIVLKDALRRLKEILDSLEDLSVDLSSYDDLFLFFKQNQVTL